MIIVHVIFAQLLYHKLFSVLQTYRPFKIPLTYFVTKMDIVCEFPTSALLPKKETGAAAFITRYPEYDGRDTVIAIFDSGVDPGASGLQVTTDGKPKIIGRYDCSGAGDVDTSTVVQDVNGEIQGLTGRTLKVPSSWTNPSGKYHLGVVNAFQIFPKKLQERVTKERKDTLWDPHHKSTLASAIRNLDSINKDLEANKSSIISREEKLKKDDAEAQVDVLNSLEKKYQDVGPVYDCVVFHDGEMFRGCLDTSGKGDFESCNLLGEYSLTRDFAAISPSDSFNYSINVHNEGNLLEVVGVCSTHGTHVACIAAANFPESPEKNGIAPGAQIVSITIGDNRLNTMETGTATARAMIHVMNANTGSDNSVDIINMSYGEQIHFSNAGHLADLMGEVVDKYGIVWVGAAGNKGPALCTVTTPPDTTVPNIIGVGAYVSPDMMQAEYSLRQKLPSMPFTWSSRGPTIDGDKGITVCAPGAAITSVSNYTLRGSQLLNGTSMSAPHTAGCIALMLSGLKAQGLVYSPFSIKRALENTALFVKSMDPFAQGYGLLQVEQAFEHLVKFHDVPEWNVRFKVSCGSGNHKGIHIRNDVQEMSKEYAITIEPIFANTDKVEADRKISFQMSLVMVCSAPWVHCPTHLEIMNLSRTISVQVDPTGLGTGVHNTCIRAYDVKRPERGPVFRVEVTLVQPQRVNYSKPELTFNGEDFQPDTIKRHFVLVPEEVTWAVVKLNTQDQPGRFIVHCVQLIPNKCVKTIALEKLVNVNTQAEVSLSLQVQGGVILEVVVAKYWASLGNVKLNYKVEFRGCRPDSRAVTMLHADGVHQVQMYSGLQSEDISPNIQIKSVVSALRPTEAKVTALTERDVIPPGRQIYQLMLNYTLHLTKSLEVTPYDPLLCNYLYESEFESQLWMLFDCNKQLLATGDAYLDRRSSVKLEKGDYTIQHQIRHEKKDLLEKLTDLPFLVSQKLTNTITVDMYGSQSQALIYGKKATSAVIPTGKHSLPLYIAPIPSEKLQKIGIPGHYLIGSITYSKDELGKKVDSYPFKYVLAESGKKVSPKTLNDKTKQEEYEEALRDLHMSWLSKIDDREYAQKLYKELCLKYNDHLPLHTAMMAHLEPDGKRQWPGISTPLNIDTLTLMASIANKVISRVDTNELLVYLGIKSDQRPNAQKIKQTMDRQKAALIDALSRLGCVQCRFFDIEAATEKPTLEDIDKIYLELLRFTDNNDKVTGQFVAWHAHVHQHYGRMLKVLLKLQEEKPCKELEESIIWAMTQLNWQHCASMISATIPARYPTSHRLF